MYKILVLVLFFFVASCGFRIQGALTTPAVMQHTYIATDDSYSQFYRELRTQLRAAGVNVVDSAAESTATLSILYDRTDQRVLSVSARNVPTEFEVYYTVRYAIDAGESGLLPTQDLTVTRDYTYDSRLVLGKAREEEVLRKDIVRDLVRIVLKQISTL